MRIELHKGDIPPKMEKTKSVAVDTETMGLHLSRDPLCLVQLCFGGDTVHLVHLDRKTYHAPHLKALLESPEIEKIFHFARFDWAILNRWLGVKTAPVYCTKLASKLIRTYTDRHSLKDLVREIIGIDLSKHQQSSDWGREQLSDAQKEYAALDVFYLHAIRDHLESMLQREGRLEYFRRCCAFLEVRSSLDLLGFGEEDIFAH